MSAKSYSAMNIKSEIKNYTNSFACRVQRKALKMDIAPWNQDLIHNNSKKTHRKDFSLRTSLITIKSLKQRLQYNNM